MSEQQAEQPQLPLVGIGPRLKAAREAAGLSRAGIAEKTRISERLIIAIEAGDWDSLPSRTYATGFTRTYAKAVGLDDVEIVSGVRREMGLADPVAHNTVSSSLEPGDPARVPGSKFAWWMALGALAIAIAGYFAWRSLYSPAMALPEALPEYTASAEAIVTTEATAPAIDASLSPMATFSPTESAAQAYRPPAVRQAEPRRPAPSAAPSASPPPLPAPSPAANGGAAEKGPAAPATPSTVSN
ncbi:MAG: helix-turn-helix domain-containing protein [Novosphingobium sp.]